jgi:hypothetical protein
VASNLHEVVAKLESVTAWPELAVVVQFWVDGLPLPAMMPPPTVGLARRLDRVDELRHIFSLNLWESPAIGQFPIRPASTAKCVVNQDFDSDPNEAQASDHFRSSSEERPNPSPCQGSDECHDESRCAQ